MSPDEPLAVDTNVLIYADDPSSPFHAAAKDFLEKGFDGKFQICLSHQILAEYFSVITSARMADAPLSPEEAKRRVLLLNRSRRIKKIHLKRSTLKRCVEFCAKHHIGGAKIFDAFYAMTLLDNRVRRLVTKNTKDFAVFKEKGLIVYELGHVGGGHV